MPVFGETTAIPNANRVMAQSFIPVANENVWPEICGSFVSTRLVETLPIPGATPPLRVFAPGQTETTLKSYKLQAPQQLFSSWTNIAQYDLEYDQTGMLVESAIAQLGASMAASPDFAIGSRLLKGHLLTALAGEDGNTYTCVIDGVPFFSAAHAWGSSTQSNIVTGTHPDSAATWAAQDMGTKVSQIVSNHDAVIKRITSLVDDQGVLMYPGFDARKSLVYWVPPVMERGCRVALTQPGAVVGGIAGGSSGTTSLPEGSSVKKITAPAFLAGCFDPYSRTGSVTPSHETNYYAFIVDRPSRPLYRMTYRPPTNANYIPQGYNPEAFAKSVEAQGVNPMTAQAYANAIINHNLSRVGANSDRTTAQSRMFYLQPTMREQVMYGFWPTAFKIVPAGTST